MRRFYCLSIGDEMKVSDFAIEVAQKEHKKQQVNIAQIKEILKIINVLTDGILYKIIRGL